MPDLIMERITTDNLDVLDRLMQLYLYDFSEMLCDQEDGSVDDDGLFDAGFSLARYAIEPAFAGYLARVDGHWAGFTLISARADQAPDRQHGHNIDEFFVLRCYRRQGIGTELARRTFDLYHGFWQVMQLGRNPAATDFWRHVIRQVTGGDYRDYTAIEVGMPVIWQTFIHRPHQPAR
jgi:predicted acetyltransferase